MIKCEVIEKFTLQKFSKLKNIERKEIDVKGQLYVGDKFECTKEMADYLMGNNDKKAVVVKVIGVDNENEEATNAYLDDKPIKTKKKKSSKK